MAQKPVTSYCRYTRREWCTCQTCKREFEEIISRIKRGRGKFCSKKCFYLSRKGIVFNPVPTYGHLGKKHSLETKRILSEKSKKQWQQIGYKEQHVSRQVYTCIKCAKQFTEIPSKKQKFCSQACAYKRWDPFVEKACLICHKKFMARKTYLRIGKARYCSKECSYKDIDLLQKRLIKKTPNKTEQLVDDFLQINFPNQWQFVGNGKVWIGKKNPDYINKNDKKIIEVFGEGWHKREEEQARIVHFQGYGFKTLVIWGKTIVNKTFKNRLLEFCKETI